MSTSIVDRRVLCTRTPKKAIRRTAAIHRCDQRVGVQTMDDTNERDDGERLIDTTPTGEPVVVAQAPQPTVVEPTVVEPTVVESTVVERRISMRSFIAGFVTAVVVAALALTVFVVVSDADDDGNLDVDVPAVDVDVDG